MNVPDTTNYMIAGYAVFFSIITFYILTLVFRWSKLMKDKQVLEEMEGNQIS